MHTNLQPTTQKSVSMDNTFQHFGRKDSFCGCNKREMMWTFLHRVVSQTLFDIRLTWTLFGVNEKLFGAFMHCPHPHGLQMARPPHKRATFQTVACKFLVCFCLSDVWVFFFCLQLCFAPPELHFVSTDKHQQQRWSLRADENVTDQ